MRLQYLGNCDQDATNMDIHNDYKQKLNKQGACEENTGENELMNKKRRRKDQVQATNK